MLSITTYASDQVYNVLGTGCCFATARSLTLTCHIPMPNFMSN